MSETAPRPYKWAGLLAVCLWWIIVLFAIAVCVGIASACGERERRKDEVPIHAQFSFVVMGAGLGALVHAGTCNPDDKNCFVGADLQGTGVIGLSLVAIGAISELVRYQVNDRAEAEANRPTFIIIPASSPGPLIPSAAPPIVDGEEL